MFLNNNEPPNLIAIVNSLSSVASLSGRYGTDDPRDRTVLGHYRHLCGGNTHLLNNNIEIRITLPSVPK